MSNPPDNDTDDGTVFMPVGFQGTGRKPVIAPSALWRAPPGTAPAPGNALPVGTRLGEFALTRVIGEGGFGIVYEAHDTSLERRVAIKEYMPAELAERVQGLLVRPLSADDEETFRKGLRSFINEAKILARFDNPSLLKVYRFWEANGTAYMVMPCYEGPTLLDALRGLREPPDEAWLRRLLEPLTEALAVIHEESVYHRDIAPDNILLLAGSGRPLLLDFGAARRVVQDAGQKAPTAIVKPGYAPIEQYSDVKLKQGPWSDVYALAAVLHLAITGKKPPAAIARLAGDAYQPLSTLAAGRYSPSLLAAIDRALIVRPDERTPSMDALRADLGFKPLPRDAAGRLLASQGTAADVGTGAGADAQTQFKRQRPSKAGHPGSGEAMRDEPSPGRAAAAAGRRPGWVTALVLAGSAALCAIAGGIWWLYADTAPVAARPPGPDAVVVAPIPAQPAASDTVGLAPQVPQPAPMPEPMPEPAPAPAPAPAPGPTNSTPAAVSAAAASLQPFSVVDEFARIQAQGTPGYSVALQWKAKPVFRIKDKDLLAMNITSTQDGYLYVLAHTPDDILFQYFPNAVSQANFIRKQQLTTIPRPVTDPRTRLIHDGIVLTDPPGQGHVLVIVSKYPRDFSMLGKRRESIYPVYPVGPQAQLLHLQLGDPQSIYLGRVRCPRGQTCEDQFWATSDAFDVIP